MGERPDTVPELILVEEARIHEMLPGAPGEERRGAGFMSRVDVLSRTFEKAPGFWLDLPLMGGNKGMEGLALVRRNGRPYLLALCEGNRCQSGNPGQVPGGGRIHVFRPRPETAAHVAEIRLPEWLWFEDYASVSVLDDRIAVLSQRSSALWIGRLEPTAWRVAGPGVCYEFPHNTIEQVAYCTVEGLAWLGNDRIVVVSDAAGGRSGRCQDKKQSVHVFRIPTPA